MRNVSEKIKKILHERPLIFQNDPSYHLSTLRKAPVMASTIYEIKKALAHGIDPEKIDLSTSTVYLMKDCHHRSLAIFKIGWHQEFDIKREIAAYYLDHQNFAMVPPAVCAEFSHPFFGSNKKGSCHLFMGDEIEGYSMNSKTRLQVVANSIRRIAALDIRILNADRHFGNYLISKNKVLPIDHALILPSFKETIHVHFDWLNWEQTKTPFSEEEKKYISAIDPIRDAHLLMQELNFSEGVVAMYLASCTLLKVGVEQGLSAYQIGKLIVPKMKSEATAFSSAIKNIDWKGESRWELYLKKVEKEMRRICDLSI